MQKMKTRFIIVFLLLVLSFFGSSEYASAAEGLCAVVKIEIRQEVTLERQAFDAHMRINNGLTNIPLENVSIELKFTDKDGKPVTFTTDPNSKDAKFFYRLDSSENLSGNSVAPSTSADIHWLIIPTTGAANGDKNGALYYVGAKLTYTLAGEENVTEVTPDYIYVKPLPDLNLDYFLPEDVYGDDAFTEDIEPPVAFNLGLRVKNTGSGIAKNMSIESAQPKIIENKQGLLIGFNIEESIVNERPAEKSLRVNLGDIPPSGASMARWVMSCSLSGKFTEFTARVSHADEFGGTLTSLIKQENVRTHFLVHDVLVDVNGRDRVRDYLAKENRSETLKVYESDGIETGVTNQTAYSSFSADSQSGDSAFCTMTTPVTSGFVYARVKDPFNGTKRISSAHRSDGKAIYLENIWLSKTRNASNEWEYFVNVFDSNTPGIYKITFGKADSGPQAPVLQFIPDITTHEGKNVSFIAEASDPNGTVPLLSASPLPSGASFTDSKNGTGAFDWTPAQGQAGTYSIIFKASDGTLSSTRRAVIKVNTILDKDGDGMPDQWETDNFSSLDQDGTGDFDKDGISDLDEYLYGTNPLREDNAPEVPVMVSPSDNSIVTTLSPVLVVQKSRDADGDPVSYEFEIFSDKELRHRVSFKDNSPEPSWQINSTLDDNSRYYWRVRAKDYGTSSLWAYGSFFVSTVNDPPDGVFPVYPLNEASIGADPLVFTIKPPRDKDEDPLTCVIDVYSDSGLANQVKTSGAISVSKDSNINWNSGSGLDDGLYYWTAKVYEPSGTPVIFGPYSFTKNSALGLPAVPVIDPGHPVSEVQNPGSCLISVKAPSNAASILFEADTDLSFSTENKKISDETNATNGDVSWNPGLLKDNSRYFWRAKARNQYGDSSWVYGKFLSSSENEIPSIPEIENPGKGSWCGIDSSALSVAPATDPEGDPLKYRFELYSDSKMTNLVASSETENRNWKSALVHDNTRYFWRAQAIDSSGNAGPFSAAATFFVKNQKSPEPEKLRINVKGSISGPMENVKIYLFRENNTYTGTSLTTDSEGKAELGFSSITPGKYRFRIDYLGKSFWSEHLDIPSQTLLDHVIHEENVTVDIEASTDAPQAIPVYLFSSTGSYLGARQNTVNGSASFAVPSGMDVKFRADILGSRYWSDVKSIIDGQANNLTVNAYGGKVSFRVQKEGQIPLPGIRLYLFSSENAYLGVQKTADSDGQAEFSLTKGSFKIRADYLGYKFWSEDLSVSADMSVAISIPHSNVTITAKSGYLTESQVLKGIPVYIFTPEGSYIQITAKTDESGQAVFNLPDREYKARADYLSHQSWSDVFNHEDATVTVPEGEAVVAVERLNQPVSGVRVYAFSSQGSYLGLMKTTDESGKSSFRLPPGGYRFRADYQGIQFWSETSSVEKDNEKTVPISLGGGTFSFRVEKAPGVPVNEARCYLFSESGQYLNVNSVTNSNGEVSFDLATGRFKIRTDYMGASWWSEVCNVPEVLSGVQTIAHKDVGIDVRGVFNGEKSPVSGINTYLFTASGSYLNQKGLTDQNGRTVFNVPEAVAYKVRADYLGQSYFSEAFTGADSFISIPKAKTKVKVAKGSGLALSDITVHLFSNQDSYLGINGKTDQSGTAEFIIPSGLYRFRATYLGSNYWTEIINLQSDEERQVNLSTGGGVAHLTVSRNDGTSIEGVKCYVFGESGSYLNQNAITSSEGKADFDLSDASYKVRVDYLGYQFWTGVFKVPAEQNQALVIPHSNITLTVRKSFDGTFEPVENANVYLFSKTGAYLNATYKTDSEGRIVAKLPDQAYRFRVDYSTKQYWVNKETNGDLILDIPMAEAKVKVDGANGLVQNAAVYVYSIQNAYLNQMIKTGVEGMSVFRLPEGDYKFRADYMAGKFWSQAVSLHAGSENSVSINTGGGAITLKVTTDGNNPVQDAKNYVFSDSGTYLNLTAPGDSNGESVFRLPDGTYKFRADYMGYRFWSQPVTVPAQASASIVIPHQNSNVGFKTRFGDDPSSPLSGSKVYLFTSSGTYLNQYMTTPENGMVQFLIPDQEYKCRLDHFGYQFWTDVFGHSGTNLTIPLGSVKINVTRSGVPAQSEKIYVYTQSGVYTGITAKTDSSGDVIFMLPTKDFKFRGGASPNYVWSGPVEVQESEQTPLVMDLGQ